MGQHEARHAVGERRLADSGGTRNQPGMGETRTPISGEQRLFRVRVAEEDGCLARGRRLDALGFVLPHETTPAGNPGARAESSRSTTTFQMRSATAGFGSVASIATQRSGSSAASRR